MLATALRRFAGQARSAVKVGETRFLTSSSVKFFLLIDHAYIRPSSRDYVLSLEQRETRAFHAARAVATNYHPTAQVSKSPIIILILYHLRFTHLCLIIMHAA